MITHVQNEWKKHAKRQGKFMPMIMTNGWEKIIQMGWINIQTGRKNGWERKLRKRTEK